MIATVLLAYIAGFFAGNGLPTTNSAASAKPTTPAGAQHNTEHPNGE